MSNTRIPFNRPPFINMELKHVENVLNKRKLSGDGFYTKECSRWLETKCGSRKALLTTSCTHAIELATILADIEEGDEVIMPSFTFVSTANAVVLRGGTPVFVDVRPDTMNIDEKKIEAAISDKTKAIIPVHYAGVSCEMDAIRDIAERHGLRIIEDAAQAIGSSYKGKMCGTFGEFGCLSFHETKNITMGEGGALLIRDERAVERAEIIREKGTDRSKFWRGEIDKYTWVDIGSSYLPSELNAAVLFAQMEMFDEIQSDRMQAWNSYYSGLEKLEKMERITRPVIPDGCDHNAHIFYIKVDDLEERDRLIAYLKSQNIGAVFHYIPLHSSPGGKKYGRFVGEDQYTTRESERLIRLPMFYGIDDAVDKVVETIYEFFGYQF